VLVTEKAPGTLPAATVVIAGAPREAIGLFGVRVRQAITPEGGLGGRSGEQLHPACASTHTRNNKSGIKARKTRWVDVTAYSPW
jgi:hypothetical protein